LSAVARVDHLIAALAVWDYSYRSTEAIFGDSLGDPTEDEILRALRGRVFGMTRTEIRDFLGRHKSKADVDHALGVLLDRGLADFETEQTDGRPAELRSRPKSVTRSTRWSSPRRDRAAPRAPRRKEAPGRARGHPRCRRTLMRRLPLVVFEDVRKVYVRRADVVRLVERRTFRKHGQAE